MEKIKILVVVTGKTGLQYHRQLVPHYYLSQEESFQISMTSDINREPDEVLKDFHIVHFLREIDPTMQFRANTIVLRLKRLGLKIVLDLDDYWCVDNSHNLYKSMKLTKYPEQIEECIQLADYVTTTHELLASKIRSTFTNNKSYDNVWVISNAINPEEKQFKIRKIENNRIRFGWIGGVHHRPDVELMRYSLAKMYSDKTIRDKFQICLGGFNTIINFSAQDEIVLKKQGCDTEAMKTMSFREMTDHLLSKRVNVPVPEYLEIENTFTDNYKIFKHDPVYLDYLRQFTWAMEHITFDKEYRRLWGTDTFNYGAMYNNIDVALVPLVDNEFNNCKSQLKIIEAGFMKKAVIVSEVHPYTIDCVNRENCLTVRKNMNLMDWFLHMKRMVNEPNLREDLAAALYETVKDKYHIATQNKIRIDLYKHLKSKG